MLLKERSERLRKKPHRKTQRKSAYPTESTENHPKEERPTGNRENRPIVNLIKTTEMTGETDLRELLRERMMKYPKFLRASRELTEPRRRARTEIRNMTNSPSLREEPTAGRV